MLRAALAWSTLALAGGSMSAVTDPHSSSNPTEATARHLALDLTVDFAARQLVGSATWELDRHAGSTVVFDTRDLTIRRVVAGDGRELPWALAEASPIVGRALTVTLAPADRSVRIEYATSPTAGALQWLAPAQTAGGRQPFLFTQSQAILARTWIPCQDSPGVRITYEATVRVPPELMAVMSAGNPTVRTADGVYRFAMPQAIPSYLFALAVGDLEFRALGERSGVYAEPSVAPRAAWELADTEAMIGAAERLYGPYGWGRYDLLVLPPAFPYGGMENPRLTFATPTILAGDRSLVALIAHELAHSWSGNLATNATWNDFWLNEGFTVYFENRIMEELYGVDYAEMLGALSRQELDRALAEIGAGHRDTWLLGDFAGRDPDEATGAIAYEKGFLFLKTLESVVGRDRIDAFLKEYFARFAYRSVDTATFEAMLGERLLAEPELARRMNAKAWLYGPGIPANAAVIRPERFARVDRELARWSAGATAQALETAGWSTHEWLRFLGGLGSAVSAARLGELDTRFHLTESGNSEVLAAWLERAVQADYAVAYPALERFLTSMGRRKFLRPLYTALAQTPAGLARAREIYSRARPTYHPVSQNTIDKIVGWTG